jgi:hypothetical protein
MAASSGALHSSGGSSGSHTAIHLNDNNENNNYVIDGLSDNNNDDNNDKKVKLEADATPADKILHLMHIICGEVQIKKDYDLSSNMRLPDANTNALAAFEAVELQAPTFFASYLLVHASWFSNRDLLFTFCCLR